MLYMRFECETHGSGDRLKAALLEACPAFEHAVHIIPSNDNPEGVIVEINEMVGFCYRRPST